MNAIRLSLVAAIVALGLFVLQALAITGGTVDEKNTYSNVGAVVVQMPGEQPWVFCSGTLIHPRVFLTAAHCTIVPQQDPSLMRYGHVSFATDAFDSKTWHDVEVVITHPGYQPPMDPGDLGNNPHLNDVGVMILKKPVRDVPLAKLPYRGFLDDLKAAGLLREPDQGGSFFTLAGYGSSLDFPPPEYVAPDGWRRFVCGDYLDLTEAWLFFRMNPATGNGGGGYGDSGGPAFWVDDDGTPVLVGVSSRGDPNRVATDIFWRADIPQTLDFIEDVIAMVDAGLL